MNGEQRLTKRAHENITRAKFRHVAWQMVVTGVRSDDGQQWSNWEVVDSGPGVRTDHRVEVSGTDRD